MTQFHDTIAPVIQRLVPECADLGTDHPLITQLTYSLMKALTSMGSVMLTKDGTITPIDAKVEQGLNTNFDSWGTIARLNSTMSRHNNLWAATYLNRTKGATLDTIYVGAKR